MPHGVVRCTQMVLLSADGETNSVIAPRFGVSVPTVAHGRRRYRAHGQVGLCGEQRPSRPWSHDDERVAGLLNKVLQSRPKHATHWTLRHVATETSVPKSTVHRFFRLFGLQPHRSKSFKLSNDPFFVDKVRDIVGLYLDLPDKAPVLCFDEKSQIQALGRTSRSCRWAWATSKASRTTACATARPRCLPPYLDVQSGKVITPCKARHRHQEFLALLRLLGASVPAALDLLPIALPQNYCYRREGVTS